MKKNILWFEEVDKNDVGIVGGKGANLGEMLNADFPVPYGFIVSANAYFDFLDANKLRDKIKRILSQVNVEDTKQLQHASDELKKIILSCPVPKHLVAEITSAYMELPERQEKILKKGKTGSSSISKLKSAYKPPLVAVRSSATAEDLPDASFAGQQDTYLNIIGENSLIHKVRDCWASLFTERAIYYRQHQGFDHFKVGLAAVVQMMIQSDSSGIAFSIDPITNNRDVITIEGIFGLGEYIVGGKVTPDHYEVDKKSQSILKKEVKVQSIKLAKIDGKNKEIKLTKDQGGAPKLTDQEIIALSSLVKKIEKHYYFPQDVEWALQDGQIFIVQSRPITTIGSDKSSVKSQKADQVTLVANKETPIAKGDPASPGLAYGRPVVLASPRENDKIKEGDILVAGYTSPDFVPAMKRSAGIITEMGGRTSHAAIVSRELGIPAVVGVENATKLLKNESIVSINGSTGEVYRGNILAGLSSAAGVATPTETKKIKTVTKIYVNLAQPEAADRVAKKHVDGIGLLRAEFIMADIGIHPKLAIKQGKQKEFIDRIVESLLKFVKPFNPRPIIYRANDFRTNEYRHLKGGEQYEPQEENPMIGFRGASRYIADPAVFAMELAAIKKIRKMGYKNINLMIPFIRLPQELAQIKKILAENELLNLPSFKLWIMVEVPSSAIMIEDFIKEGIDGVSIGTNDLTMLLLGVDRDNQEIAHLYDERFAVVQWALERVIKACVKNKITCSICGQAPSDYPELAEKLVKWGITSISVTPDVIERTRAMVADIEKKIWQPSKK